MLSLAHLETPAIEPLPPYSPPAHQSPNTSTAPQPTPQHDPETASIRSSAPSYNEPPAYDQVVSNSSAPSSSPRSPSESSQAGTRSEEQPPQGLPRLHYAPGFVPRPNNPFSAATYSLSAWAPWPTLECNPRRRQYENVARRRVEQGVLIDTLVGAIVEIVNPQAGLPQGQQGRQQQRRGVEPEQKAMGEGERVTTSLLDIHAAPQPALRRSEELQVQGQAGGSTLAVGADNNGSNHSSSSTSSTTPTSPHSSSASTTIQPPPSTDIPVSPHEDPILVGPLAAARARSQRLYREMIVRDPARVLAQESHSWDFILAQSADWEERQRTWKQFQKEKEEKHWRWRARRWARG
jgi:hypothetical protein